MASGLLPGCPSTARVLAIQSTVSHGYVGNKAATFPLQCMGFNVDAINTVSLSNHPDYPNGFKGQFLSVEEMRQTLEGMQENGLLCQDVVLSGYTRAAELLVELEATLQLMKKSNPSMIYVCDPVLGDNGNFYVPEELLDVYKVLTIFKHC
jgi:pyridoxine kinase